MAFDRIRNDLVEVVNFLLFEREIDVYRYESQSSLLIFFSVGGCALIFALAGFSICYTSFYGSLRLRHYFYSGFPSRNDLSLLRTIELAGLILVVSIVVSERPS